MFYKFLNKRVSKKISKLHSVVAKYLSDDVKKNDDKVISERLKVFRNHALLHKYFEADKKRLYIINRNYLNFLKAIMFLYKTSKHSVSLGVHTAPKEIYHTITAVQESFSDVTKSLSLK